MRYEESFTVLYHDEPIEFLSIPGQGWRYRCPRKCCTSWHWIDTESGTRHKIVSAANAPVSIVASLKCPCPKGCDWHVVITDGVARDA